MTRKTEWLRHTEAIIPQPQPTPRPAPNRVVWRAQQAFFTSLWVLVWLLWLTFGHYTGPLSMPVFVALTIGVIVWLASMVLSQENIIFILETFSRRDINQDSHIGKPPAPAPIRIDQRTANNAMRYDQIAAIDQRQLLRLAQHIVRNGRHSFSRRKIRDIVQRDTYTQLRDELLECGFVSRDNEATNSTVTVTANGWRFFKAVEAHPPTLD